MACTRPLALPTNIWSPMTVGCAKAEMSPSNPNAHFSFSFGTSAAVSFASAAGTNRELSRDGLHPFHDSLVTSPSLTVRSAQNASAPGPASGSSFPRNFATASRSTRRIG
jgi:hypothetical protein